MVIVDFENRWWRCTLLVGSCGSAGRTDVANSLLVINYQKRFDSIDYESLLEFYSSLTCCDLDPPIYPSLQSLGPHTPQNEKKSAPQGVMADKMLKILYCAS